MQFVTITKNRTKATRAKRLEKMAKRIAEGATIRQLSEEFRVSYGQAWRDVGELEAMEGSK